MIEIIPAIDIIGGRCVRLSQGDFDRRSVYSGSPSGMVDRFLAAGLRRIHAVDLDGAREGRPVHLGLLRELASREGADLEWGGGIQGLKDVEAVLAAGARRVILGTAAVLRPDLLRESLERFGPQRIVLGADVRGRAVATRGWTETTRTDVGDLIDSFMPGLAEVIVTQIGRDGMLGGADVPLYRSLSDRFPGLRVIASGGVGSLRDIEDLDAAGIPGVIVGKAIYENKIRLEDLRKWL